MKKLLTIITFTIFLTGFLALSQTAAQSVSPLKYLSRNDKDNSLMNAVRQTRLKESRTENSPFEQNRFSQQGKLTASDGASDDEFGIKVAISGDTAVVGSWHDDVGSNINQGSAYVFVRSGASWVFQQKLTASDGAADDNFGYSVAVANVNVPAQTVIMVGAIGNDSGGSNRGAVYVFVRAQGGTTWSANGKLTASDGADNDAFGNSVSISGNLAIIGANGVDIGDRVSAGAAYIFARGGTVWAEEQKIPCPGGGFIRRNFGWSVGISGTLAIIGSNNLDSDTGHVYIYERATGGNTWSLGPGFQTGGKFGYDVAISGETFVASAYSEDINGNMDQGRIYVYSRIGGTWTGQGALTASDGAANDYFGYDVAISGDTIIAGAHADDVQTFEQGSAYIFKRSGTSWAQRQKLTASDYNQGDFFSWSVAISGDTAIVGAIFDDIGSNTNQGSAYVFNSTSDSPFDFDGDGKTDISIFRPSAGEWWYLRSSNGGNYAAQFGNSSDKLVPGDYTGDGRTDIAIFRPSSGEWFILRSEDGSYYSFPFGVSTDIPAVGDFDADGRADSAVFRPSDTNWYIRRSSDGGFTIQQFGASGDVPVVADYDADGKSDIAIYRPSLGQWWISRSSAGTIAYTFGNSADKPVQGDYTGDGKADVAIWRPSTGEWFILRSENQSFYSFPFGTTGDVPAPGDYDGDGKFDATVFRPSGSTWYVQRSTAGTLIQNFGISGDLPVPNAFVP